MIRPSVQSLVAARSGRHKTRVDRHSDSPVDSGAAPTVAVWSRAVGKPGDPVVGHCNKEEPTAT